MASRLGPGPGTVSFTLQHQECDPCRCLFHLPMAESAEPGGGVLLNGQLTSLGLTHGA
jgi:hypothetical protein